MNHYWDVPQDEAMIATFLDPRCKSLNFASETQKTNTKNLLKKYMTKQNRIQVLPNNKLIHNHLVILFSVLYSQVVIKGVMKLMNIQLSMKLDLVLVPLNGGRLKNRSFQFYLNQHESIWPFWHHLLQVRDYSLMWAIL